MAKKQLEGITESLFQSQQTILNEKKFAEQTVKNQGDAITNLEIQHSKLCKNMKNSNMNSGYSKKNQIKK